MSDSEEKMLNEELVNKYLNDLSKELKKEFGRNKEFELIVVGGAAILLNYDFRASTTDIDAFISTGTSVKSAIYRVADKYGLSSDWLNSDFRLTSSYSPHLVRYSHFYKTYNQILTVRTIEGAYLIAMKLASFRAYKRDKSDIIGILDEHQKRGNAITYEQIDKAVTELYGGWDVIDSDAKEYIKQVTSIEGYSYETVLKTEDENKALLIDFEKNYKNVLNEENLEDVLNALRDKAEQKDTIIPVSPRTRRPRL